MISPAVATVAVAVLVLWVGASILNSIPGFDAALARVFGAFVQLIPKWNFFSPHPGQHDYYLFYRDRRSDESWGDWRKVPHFNEFPEWSGAVWNPHYYRDKALFDATVQLEASLAQKMGIEESSPTAQRESLSEEELTELVPVDLEEIEASMPYLTLLKHVSEQVHAEDADAVQFAVLRSSREIDGFEPVMVSNAHDV